MQKGMSLDRRHRKIDLRSPVLVGHCWESCLRTSTAVAFENVLLDMPTRSSQRKWLCSHSLLETYCEKAALKDVASELPFSTMPTARPGMHANCDDPCVMQNSTMSDMGKFLGMVRGQ